jgi:hypothetical protein
VIVCPSPHRSSSLLLPVYGRSFTMVHQVCGACTVDIGSSALHGFRTALAWRPLFGRAILRIEGGGRVFEISL